MLHVRRLRSAGWMTVAMVVSPVLALGQALSVCDVEKAAAERNRLRVSFGVMNGLKVKVSEIPVSPETSQALGKEKIAINLLISREGKVICLTVPDAERAPGNFIHELTAGQRDRLLQEVFKATREWQFRPYLLNREAIAVETTLFLEHQDRKLKIITKQR